MNKFFTKLCTLITLARILWAAMTWQYIKVDGITIRPIKVEMEDGSGMGWNIYGYTPYGHLVEAY